MNTVELSFVLYVINFELKLLSSVSAVALGSSVSAVALGSSVPRYYRSIGLGLNTVRNIKGPSKLTFFSSKTTLPLDDMISSSSSDDDRGIVGTTKTECAIMQACYMLNKCFVSENAIARRGRII